jgi:hypothetical protein
MHFVRNGFYPRALDPWRTTWFGRSLRTIRTRLRRAEMPPPGRLTRVGCVLHGCKLARFLTMDEAARRVGVASAKELYAKRNGVRRSLGRWVLFRRLLGRESRQFARIGRFFRFSWSIVARMRC